MAVTRTYTVSTICTRALRKIGVVAIDEAATAEIIEIAREGLEMMLKSWQNRELDRFLTSSMSIACTTNAAYTLDPVRPLRIKNVRFRQQGRDLPMVSMVRDQYDNLPVKDTTGIPTQYYYDRQREAAQLFVWPVLSAVNGETLEITYVREIEDVDLNDAIDMPAEWYNAAVYGLADQLADDFDITKPTVTARANQLLNEALAFDREGSVYFAGPEAI